jgi:hypothetical protein
MRHLLNAAVAAVSLLAASASAHTTAYYSSGAWSAFRGTADDGKRVCGISESGNDRILTIKYFEGDDGLTMQIFKSGWQIPPDTKANVRLQFDKASPWQAVASGFITGAGTSGLELRIPSGESLRRFGIEFRYSNQIIISFLDGDEGAWTGKLSGSDAAYTVFANCIGALQPSAAPTTSNRETTQPFAKGQQSQPFSGSQPAQPFSAPQPTKPVIDRGGFQYL